MLVWMGVALGGVVSAILLSHCLFNGIPPSVGKPWVKD